MKFLRTFAANRMRLVAAVALGTLVLPFGCRTNGAGDDAARVEKLGHRMICMCGCNQVLLECNHYGCPYLTPEQQELVAAVAKGDTDSGILEAFVAQYGPTVLAAPTTHGFDQVAWIMPYLVLALGVGGVVLVVRNWHKRAAAAPAPTGPSANVPDLDRFREQARKETEL